METMKEEDCRDRLKESPFSFRVTKNGDVFIYWGKVHATTLRAGEAAKFLRSVEMATEYEQQSLMARVTGNFKRGNERKR